MELKNNGVLCKSAALQFLGRQKPKCLEIIECMQDSLIVQLIAILLPGSSLEPFSRRVHLINGLGGGLPIVIIPTTWIYMPQPGIGGFYFDKMDTGMDVFAHRLVRSDCRDVDSNH